MTFYMSRSAASTDALLPHRTLSTARSATPVSLHNITSRKSFRHDGQ